MTSIEIAKYIFKEQSMDWEFHCIKNRKRELITAKYTSIYLVNWFYPKRINECVDLFGIDRCTIIHAIKQVKNLLFSDKWFRKDMDKYMNELREKINAEEKNVIDRMMEDERAKQSILDTIDKMELIAKVYCEIMNKK